MVIQVQNCSESMSHASNGLTDLYAELPLNAHFRFSLG